MSTSSSVSNPVIACAADDRYSLPLAVMLYSALRNYDGCDDFEIYILDAGISAVNQQKIRGVLAPFRVHLHWLNPTQADSLSGLPLSSTWPIAAYFRLLIPELLPATINKAIYLDSDILVETDLSRLWQKDIANKYFLAAQDTGRKTKFIANSSLSRCPEIEFSEEDQYFNSGVLVMNLSLLRKDKFVLKVIEFLKKWQNQSRFPDQDGLNAVAIGKWGKLEPSYNSYVSFRRPKFKYTSDSILHYLDPKPWISTQTKYFDRSEVGKAHDVYQKYMFNSGWFAPTERLRHLILCTLFRYVGGPLRACREIAYRIFHRTV